MESPHIYINILDECCVQAQKEIAASLSLKDNCKVKEPCFARITNLPNHYSIQRTTTPGSNDLGKMISLTGTVIRMGANKMMETRRTFQCNKCNGTFEVKADLEQFNLIPKPMICQASTEVCEGKYFASVEIDSGKLIFYSIIFGSIPKSIPVVLQDDLVDTAKSGDNVTIVGVVIRRWKSLCIGVRPEISLCLVANSITVHNNHQHISGVSLEMKKFFRNHWLRYQKNPMRGRDIIVSSVCPQVYGLYVVKLSVLLVLIGGIGKNEPSGLKVRGETHLLLVGDPGTAKSQFLKYASQISPRSVLTTGIGTTSAGLTVAAVRDGAATNPKGNYDTEQSISVNVALGSPLLSRFDLVLVLLDSHNEKWDTRVSSFILDEEKRNSESAFGQIPSLNTSTPIRNGVGRTQLAESSFSPTIPRKRVNENDNFATSDLLGKSEVQPFNKNNSSNNSEIFLFVQLQQYIMWVKSQFEPKSTSGSEKILTKYYQLQRKSDIRNSSRTTIRLLESLIRISQAHARLMARDKVTVQDAIVTVMLFEASIISTSSSFLSSILNQSDDDGRSSIDILHADFPDNPDTMYKKYEKAILEKLGLSDMLANN
ncbi:hypothetical protein BB561_000061 [Smittium simulii]|uniref:MCM C-terminal AAA(+) ATPase domain-containing protein n=1 Tax=Smittium simulii TaxID=133385 RepID=A0A2T9Z0U9_9FUNG|nr:hypothetical protein BB561_000061 [Smittium simulii]